MKTNIGGRKRHVGRLIALAVFAVIAIGLVTLYAINSSKSIIQPSMTSINGSVPSVFLPISSAVNSSGAVNATETLVSMIQGRARNSSNVSVRYRGGIYGHLSGFGSIISLDTPISINYTRSGSNLSVDINASGLPIIGPVFFQLINNRSVAKVCSNINVTALKNSNIFGIKSNGASCSQISSYSTSIQQIENFNYSELTHYGIIVNYTSVHQSVYEEQNCTYISGTLGQPSKSGVGQFSMCISDSELVPLTMYTSFKNSQGSIYMLLNETQ